MVLRVTRIHANLLKYSPCDDVHITGIGNQYFTYTSSRASQLWFAVYTYHEKHAQTMAVTLFTGVSE